MITKLLIWLEIAEYINRYFGYFHVNNNDLYGNTVFCNLLVHLFRHALQKLSFKIALFSLILINLKHFPITQIRVMNNSFTSI